MELLPKCIWKTMFLFLGFLGISRVHAQDTLVVDSVVLSNRSGLENILQGNVAGLRIKSWSGTPGAQSIINLRGLNLDPTDQSTMPLIMINGVPIISSPSNVTGINPLSYFSSDQIERVEVIKEIDLLAKYGVLAANGALNIIMKEGKTGAIHVRGSAFGGANFLQDMDHQKDAFYDFNTSGRRAVYGNGGIVNEQNIIVDGGGDFGSYLFGLTNYQDKGTIKGSGFGRQSLFLNAKYNISKEFSLHFFNNLALANRNGRYAGEFNRDLLLPVINDESFFMNKNRNIGLVSSMALNYQFSPKFKISSVAGLSYEGASRDMYVPSTVLDGNIYAASAAYKRQLITVNTSLNYLHEFSGNIYAASAAYKRQLITVNTSLNYLHEFSDALKLDMTIGNELRNTDNRLTSVDGKRSLENGGSNYVKVVTGYNASQVNAFSNHEIEKLLSFYGIWKFKYKEDMTVNMVLRTDGSSFYANKWALYPALGLHYDLKNSLKIPVKVNASIGKTGILNKPEIYRGQLEGYGDYFGGNELGIGLLYPAFQDAKSINVYQFDAGVAVDINRSMNFSVNYFNKIYKDFIYQRYLPNINGIDYQYEMGGSLGLSGFEFNLDGKWINKRDFSWSSNLNIAAYRNKVRTMPADINNTNLVHLSTLTEGDALTSLVAYEGKQLKIIGNSEPKAFGGISNTLRYKNISASMTLTYAWGADVSAESFTSKYYADNVGNDFPLKNGESPYYTTSTDVNGRTIYQGIRQVEDGSFIRLNKVAVSYNFGSMFKRMASISDMVVFVRGDNLLTLSKYSGVNPEENIAGIRKSDLSFTGTPLSSSVVLGLKLVF